MLTVASGQGQGQGQGGWIHSLEAQALSGQVTQVVGKSLAPNMAPTLALQA